MGEVLQFAFTPYFSAENAKEIFYSNLFTPYDRGRIFSGYLGSVHKFAGGMPWLRQHVLFFVEGILGSVYQVIQEQEGASPRVITPEPTTFCMSFVGVGMDILGGEHDYHAFVDCVPYFVSALSYADDVSFRKYINVTELVKSAEDRLKEDLSSDLTVDFAIKITERKKEIFDNWNKNSHLDQ